MYGVAPSNKIKVVGECVVNVAAFSEDPNPQNLDLVLQNCPDKNAYIQLSIKMMQLGEFEGMEESIEFSATTLESMATRSIDNTSVESVMNEFRRNSSNGPQVRVQMIPSMIKLHQQTMCGRTEQLETSVTSRTVIKGVTEKNLICVKKDQIKNALKLRGIGPLINQKEESGKMKEPAKTHRGEHTRQPTCKESVKSREHKTQSALTSASKPTRRTVLSLHTSA